MEEREKGEVSKVKEENDRKEEKEKEREGGIATSVKEKIMRWEGQ